MKTLKEIEAIIERIKRRAAELRKAREKGKAARSMRRKGAK